MITEEDQDKIGRQNIENGIRLCEEALAKAEKYERLSDNSDWKSFWKDLEILVGVHDREIVLASSMLPDAPNTTYVKDNKVVSSKQDWADFIIRHEIQRQEIQRWMKEPDHILELAATARKTLPILKEKLKAYEVASVKDNGKP